MPGAAMPNSFVTLKPSFPDTRPSPILTGHLHPPLTLRDRHLQAVLLPFSSKGLSDSEPS